MEQSENKEVGDAPKVATVEQDTTEETSENSITANNTEDKTEKPNDEPDKKSFWRELWEESKELLHHAIIFAFLLTVLSIFSFIIPLLPFSKENQDYIKNLDFVGIYLAILIYTAYFLYRIIKHIVEGDSELKSIVSRLSPFGKPIEGEKKSDADTSKPQFSRMAVLNRICDFLILASLALTLVFAINDNWFFSFSIPIIAFIKGILFVVVSPSEIIILGWICVICIVAGSSISAASLYRKEFPPISWWIPAAGLLGLGFGIAAGIVKIGSMSKPEQQSKNG